MGLKETFYPESRFGGYTDVDGTVRFYTRVNALLEPSMVVLDVGCGRGEYDEDPVPIRRSLRILKGKAQRVIGIDVDTAGEKNPCLDEFRRIDPDDPGAWPVADSSIDLLVCDFVMEHVPDPDRFFAEAARVLVDGGCFCMRTPNSRSYVALVSRLVPNRSHAKVLGHVQDGRKEEDVFPTYYRCNTPRRIRAMLAKHGFSGVVYCGDAEPSYLSFSKWAYALGVFYQRHAPRFLGTGILTFARLRK
jgi:ubiquinone/menaquinone biosynthesis C-methylase UbiE